MSGKPWGTLYGPSCLARQLRPGKNETASFLLAVVLTLFLANPTGSWSQAGYEKKQRPTPTPSVNRASQLQRDREEVYEGYAKLFVLGHILSRLMGVEGIVPTSINLDTLANQPFLAEAGDVFVYRSGHRDDVMWPLVLPTPQKETPTPTPTETATVASTPEPEATMTPTPTLTPTEVVPPPFKLQAVSQSSRGNLVMISDRLLAVGDTIEGATVTDIKKRHAKVIYAGKTFFVTSKGTVRSEDFKEEALSFEISP